MRADDFFERVQRSGSLSSVEEAEQWSTAVLRSLTHLLPDAESRRHFVSQLPGPLKSRLLDEPPRSLSMDRDAFLQHLASALGVHAPTAERALRVVYAVVKEAVSAGEIDDLEAHVPRDIAALLKRAA
jgi:uncharacterized protein (DUF2267 family)